MKNLFFSEEHNLFRQGFREFLQKEVVPHINTWEKNGRIDSRIFRRFGEMGYFGLQYPEIYGGLDLDLFYMVIFLEELQRVNSGGFAAAMWAHTYLAMTHLNAEGSEDIKMRYLAPSIRGEKVGCLCISEPFGGSDVGAMRTTASRTQNGYIINGSKTFITNGVYSDYLVVAAKTEPSAGKRGISLFVLDRDTPGITATKLDKLGWRASDTGEIAFDDVEVPGNHLIGAPNDGFYYLMQHFSLERLIMGVNAHARAEYALEYALQYMSERKAFARTLNKFQVLRHRMAQHASEVEMAKTFNYHVVNSMEAGEYVVKEATMSKLISTQIADRVVHDCLQVLGGYGYMEDYPMARLYRDNRLGQIGGGTSEILCEILSKIIVDKQEYKPKLQTH